MKSRFTVLAVVILSLAIMFLACQTKEVTSAKVYIQQDNWDKAIEQLEMAVSMYPTDAEAHFMLGQGMAEKQQWERMNEMFDKSLAIAPMFEAQIKNTIDKNYVNQLNAGVSKTKAGDFEAAIENYKTANIISPDRVEGYVNLAATYANIDSFETAVVFFKKALDIQPDDKTIVNNLASTYFNLKDWDGVIELLTGALESDPSDADFIANLAIAYQNKGEHDKAMDMYEKVIAENPDMLDLKFNLAQLYSSKGEHEKAIKLYDDVIVNNPDDFDANSQVGQAYLIMAGDLASVLNDKIEAGEEVSDEQREEVKDMNKKAIPYLLKATEINPNVWQIWENLGIAYLRVDEREKAEESMAKSAELQEGQ
jgi:tetratricopeptide (TPR) repeat protein